MIDKITIQIILQYFQYLEKHMMEVVDFNIAKVNCKTGSIVKKYTFRNVSELNKFCIENGYDNDLCGYRYYDEDENEWVDLGEESILDLSGDYFFNIINFNCVYISIIPHYELAYKVVNDNGRLIVTEIKTHNTSLPSQFYDERERIKSVIYKTLVAILIVYQHILEMKYDDIDDTIGDLFDLIYKYKVPAVFDIVYCEEDSDSDSESASENEHWDDSDSESDSDSDSDSDSEYISDTFIRWLINDDHTIPEGYYTICTNIDDNEDHYILTNITYPDEEPDETGRMGDRLMVTTEPEYINGESGDLYDDKIISSDKSILWYISYDSENTRSGEQFMNLSTTVNGKKYYMSIKDSDSSRKEIYLVSEKDELCKFIITDIDTEGDVLTGNGDCEIKSNGKTIRAKLRLNTSTSPQYGGYGYYRFYGKTSSGYSGMGVPIALFRNDTGFDANHTLTVNYVYSTGGEVKPSVIERYTHGQSFSVETPSMEGYVIEADAPTSGRMTQDRTITFTYTEIQNILYQKITDISQLTDGDYLIVYEDNSYAFDGSRGTLDAVNNYIDVVIDNDKIELEKEEDTFYFTIETTGDSKSIKSESGYYIGQTRDANGLTSSELEIYPNTINFDADGSVNIISSKAHLRFNSTSGQMRFRYFKSKSYTGQKAISLYKKIT